MSVSTAQWILAAHRVVLDASALIAACISPNGAARELYSMAEQGRVILIMCDYTIHEVTSTLERKNYIVPLTWLEISLRNLKYHHVPNPLPDDVRNNLSLVRDRDDVPYLLLARDHDASCIVSHDKDLLDLGHVTFGDIQIPIMNPGDFLQMMRAAF